MNKHQLFTKLILLVSFTITSIFSFAQVTQQWVARYDGPSLSRDGVNDIAVDKVGNVYVTGTSATGDFTSSFTTIKYNSNGEKIWGKTYRSPDNFYDADAPSAIAVDDAGNVYVTGRSKADDSDADIATIKYDANGNMLWVKIYTGFELQIPWDIAVDAMGNVYVTGYSDNEQLDHGGVTLKYDTSGNLLWEKRQTNGFGTTITLDKSGNVYVAGDATIKYSSMGTQLWANEFPADRAKSIAVDDLGNVYVNGDGTTIKYNTSGKTLWTKVSPDLTESRLTIDKNNNVYITGTVQGATTGSNIRTVKYSTNGAWLWSKAYNSKYNLDDRASEIEAAPDGNIYVTGQSQTGEQKAEYVTLKYSTSGTQLWMKTSSANDNVFAYPSQLAVDAWSNAYIAGSIPGKDFNRDFVTVKYEADGKWLWTKKFDGKGRANELAKAVTTDAAGNIYVTGRTSSYQTEEAQADFVTVKYDPTGKQLWSKLYTGDMEFRNSYDIANDIAVDANSNVYVVGSTLDANDKFKFTVIKYDASGNELWVKNNYNGSATAVQIDALGNIYVTGSPNMTVKYAPNGSELWVNQSVGGTVLKLDAGGNAYIASSKNDENFKESLAAYKINTNGSLVWSSTYGNGRVADIAVDNTGSAYITGWDYNANQIVTVKYNASGTLAWAKTFDNARSNAIGVDANNYVFVTGTSNGDYITIKYNSGGTQLWSKSYNGPNNFNDEAVALVVDAQGSVYVTGISEVNGVNGPDYSNDYATVKYDAAGNEIWVKRYNAYGNGYDEAADIVLDKWNNVIVTGSSEDKNRNWDFATIKYVQTDESASVTQTQKTDLQLLLDANIFKATNTPNPFINSTNIQYSLPYDGKVLLIVNDALGREVAKLVNAEQKAGSYNTRFTTEKQKGMYYYRITLITENKTYTQTGKMISN